MRYFCYSRQEAFALDYLFRPNFFIKRKTDVIKIWLDLIRIIITVPYSSDRRNKEIIIFKNENFKRVFFLRDNQIVSLNFPFRLIHLDNNLLRVYLKDQNITSIELSKLQEILNGEEFFSSCFYSDIDRIFNTQEEDRIWLLLKEILLAEDGYIRYDYDMEHHPDVPHHFDIFFTNNSTFKLGLRSEINLDAMIDILDRNTNIYFVNR